MCTLLCCAFGLLLRDLWFASGDGVNKRRWRPAEASASAAADDDDNDDTETDDERIAVPPSTFVYVWLKTSSFSLCGPMYRVCRLRVGRQPTNRMVLSHDWWSVNRTKGKKERTVYLEASRPSEFVGHFVVIAKWNVWSVRMSMRNDGRNTITRERWTCSSERTKLQQLRRNWDHTHTHTRRGSWQLQIGEIGEWMIKNWFYIWK